MKRLLLVLAALLAPALAFAQAGVFPSGDTFTSGNPGMFILGVRNDAGTPLFGNGLFMPLTFDASGNLRVTTGGGGGGTSSTFGAAFPATGTAAGFFDGTNMQGARLFDLDTGGGTDWNLGVSLRVAGAGASSAITATGTSLNVNCTGGCVAGGSFTDSSAFSFGTTSVGPVGWVVDDVATNAVAENSAGTPRMSTSRVAYFNLRNPSGTEVVTTTAAPGGADLGLVVRVAGTAAVSSTQLPAALVGGRLDDNVGSWLGSTAPTVGSKTSANSVPVVIASDQGAVAVTNTPPANQSVNVAQIAGTNTVTGGVAGLLAVAGAGASGATKSGNPVQIGGVFNTTQPTVTTGQTVEAQATARGALIVAPGVDNTATNAWFTKITDGTTTAAVIAGTTALKTDMSSVAGTATVTSAAGVQRVGIVGGLAGAFIDSNNNGTAPANVIAAGFQLQSGATATAGTAGQIGNAIAGLDHVLYARVGGPVTWSCFVEAATVTTQCRAAPAAGIKAYVTSIACSNEAATVQGVDVVFGTGAACVTGTTALTHKFQMGTLATTTSPFVVAHTFSSPLNPTAANAVCVRPTAATAFGCTLTGYDAP